CTRRTVALGSAGNFWAARGDSDRAGHLGQVFVVGRGFRRAAVGKPALGHDPPDSVYNRGHDLRGGPLTGAASRAIHLSRGRSATTRFDSSLGSGSTLRTSTTVRASRKRRSSRALPPHIQRNARQDRRGLSVNPTLEKEHSNCAILIAISL